MTPVWCIFVVVLVGAPAALSISPKAAVVKANSRLDVTCTNGTKPLDKCIFWVWLENDIGEEPASEPLDFSRGSASATLNRRRSNREVNFKAQYLGEGLKLGHCGMTLSELTEGRYFVGCRVHVENDEWRDDFMSLVVHSSGKDEKKEGSDPFQNQTVDVSKDSRAFVFNAPDNIQDCEVFLLDKSPLKMTLNDRKKSGGSYEGSLEGRKCSVTLRSVTLRSGGPIWALYRVAGESEWQAFAPQIIYVKASPGSATLTVDEGSGENVAAKCSVPAGVPVARLRWELDGKVVRQDEASSVDAWDWPWDSQPIVQRFKVDRRVTHNVTCHVFHPDFNNEVMPVLTVDIPKINTTSVVVSTTPPSAAPITPRAPTTNNATTTSTDNTDGAGDSGLSGWGIFGIIVGVLIAIGAAVLGFFGYKHRAEVCNVIGYRPSGTRPAKGRELVCIVNAQKLPADDIREMQEVRILGAEKSPADANSL